MFNRLQEVSTIIGERADYVQGAGGNTSVKINDRQMAIKASGTLLSELTKESGFAVVDYLEVKALLKQTIDNDQFSQATTNLLAKEYHTDISVRPSIETGFHALLNTYTIHTHSVYANVLTCSDQGEALCKSLFPDAIWVSYQKPGLELTRSILDAISKRPTDKNSKNIIFLQNHGVIVSAQSSDEAVRLHQKISDTIIKQLNLPAWSDSVENLELEFMRDHVLFPDQVIFTQHDTPLLNSTAGKETVRAYEYIHHAILSRGFTARYLSEKDMLDLLGMESEKYRQSIAK